ncbi:hypothetical protein P0M11_11470 [Kaistella sp. PBT33-4]|nr:hypothetical protein [Kaistella sp. PBT33-4]MDF0720617.1 hypothetical protein [Kaistella sp. PBT33-4]
MGHNNSGKTSLIKAIPLNVTFGKFLAVFGVVVFRIRLFVAI